MPSTPVKPAADRPAEADASSSDDPLSSRHQVGIERPGGVEVSIDIDPTLSLDPADLAWVEDHAVRSLCELGLSDGRLGVALLGDAEMARLHEAYKHEAGPTDVLTFDLRDADGPSDALDGDIAVGWDEATRRATQLGHPVRHEALLYVVHGLMHLLGEDDHTPEDAARMHAREDALLEAIGVGAVFARPGAEP